MHLPESNKGVAPIQRVAARTAEIGGGVTVHRVLPAKQRRMIGAWCFLDHAGPTLFESASGLRVGPHPHIGLQTFTWMIKGEALHRDSLGNVQIIRPGQVNLMTAGRGITHTEESANQARHLHSVQLWIALPKAEQKRAPAFDHYPDLPTWLEGGLRATLLAGSFAGRTAPGRFYSPLVGIDLRCCEAAVALLNLNPEYEYGILPLEGYLSVNGEIFASNELAFLGKGLSEVALQAFDASHSLLLGGVPFSEDIHVWWNFVAHDKAEIDEALQAWNNLDRRRFGDVEGFDGNRLIAPEPL
ncbi:pirin family protein [Pseudomonas abietaniphila]|nr:pirin family protein [Pseudomonas abietaniphila]